MSCASKERCAGAGGCREAFSRVFTCQVKAEEVSGGGSVCAGHVKGHRLLQPLTEAANSTKMQQDLAGAPKYNLFSLTAKIFKTGVTCVFKCVFLHVYLDAADNKNHDAMLGQFSHPCCLDQGLDCNWSWSKATAELLPHCF